MKKMTDYTSEQLKEFYQKYHFRDATGSLIKHLEKWKRRVRENDYDYFVVCCGRERLGKTTMVSHVAEFISDSKLKIQDFALTADRFAEILVKNPQGSPVIYDEAGTGLLATETTSLGVRKLVKAFMVVGLKNHFVFLCIPDYFSLVKYVKSHRINLLIYINNRGKFKAYNRTRAKKIAIFGAREKKMEVVRPNSVGIFKKEWVNPELEIAYRRVERKQKLGYLNNQDPRLDKLTLPMVIKITGQTPLTVRTDIKKKRLIAQKLNRNWYITKEDLKNYIAEKGLINLGLEG